MVKSTRWLGALLGLALLAASGPAGAQETQWQKNHPRRAQVNKRLGNQNGRIDQGVRSGKLSQQHSCALLG